MVQRDVIEVPSPVIIFPVLRDERALLVLHHVLCVRWTLEIFCVEILVQGCHLVVLAAFLDCLICLTDTLNSHEVVLFLRAVLLRVGKLRQPARALLIWQVLPRAGSHRARYSSLNFVAYLVVNWLRECRAVMVVTRLHRLASVLNRLCFLVLAHLCMLIDFLRDLVLEVETFIHGRPLLVISTMRPAIDCVDEVPLFLSLVRCHLIREPASVVVGQLLVPGLGVSEAELRRHVEICCFQQMLVQVLALLVVFFINFDSLDVLQRHGCS